MWEVWGDGYISSQEKLNAKIALFTFSHLCQEEAEEQGAGEKPHT